MKNRNEASNISTRPARATITVALVALLGVAAAELWSCGEGKVSAASVRGCDTWRDCEEGESCQSGRCMVLPPSTCGNGTIEPGEECDFGEANADTGYCTTSCRHAVCGDGLVWQGTEQCDDGNSEETDSCTSDCRANVCGDGIVNRGVEACDSGKPLGNMTCDESCRPISCGDGELDADQGEVCDHGDRNHPSLDCLPNCLPARCGDGFRNESAHSDEECDLGSGIDGNTESAACTPGCKQAYCGDGMVWEGHEECDDGNTDGGDGCSETCGVEANHCCIVPGEACVSIGTLHPSEPCLACYPASSKTSWSPVDPGEACEDGNPCTLTGACDGAGTCVSGGPRTCDDGNPCTVGTCHPDGDPDNPCVFTHAQDGTSCADAVFCDGAETCQAGQCTPPGSPCSGSAPVCNESASQCVQCLQPSDCNDNNPCTTDVCTAAHTCSHASCSGSTPQCLAGTGCVECTSHSHCAGYCDNTGPSPSYTCVECLEASHCEDGNLCTTNTCTVEKTCTSSYCSGSRPVCAIGVGCVACTQNSHCSDGISCTTDRCSGYTCSNTDSCGVRFCLESEDRCVECVDNSDCPGEKCDHYVCVPNLP